MLRGVALLGRNATGPLGELLGPLPKRTQIFSTRGELFEDDQKLQRRGTHQLVTAIGAASAAGDGALRPPSHQPLCEGTEGAQKLVPQTHERVSIPPLCEELQSGVRRRDEQGILKAVGEDGLLQPEPRRTVFLIKLQMHARRRRSGRRVFEACSLSL
jgi:hypothetical protein